jgi:hypothetical protein
MKKALTILGGIAGFIVLVIVLGITFFYMHFPDVDKLSSVVVERTPERIARGKYLANHVSVCLDCHSKRDYTLFSGPIEEGTEGMGGEKFGPEMGFPGTFYAPNITPAGIGSLTDGELLRTITSGVPPDGRVLFPLMPYPHYNVMSDEDLYSIIAYIRTLPSHVNDVPRSSMNFPVSMFMRALPSNHESHAAPDPKNKLDYGEYLVNAAGCTDCHTQAVKGEPVKGMAFAGGREFPTPMGLIRSANITPDDATGIGLWNEDIFIARFKDYDNETAKKLDPAVVGYSTLMPWTMYAGMTEEDLGAIFAYLHTIPAVSNTVVKFEPPRK